MTGYDRTRLLRDLGAGLVVGVVAIPLSLAFAIASGAPPEAGLATAVVAGFLVSFFGGSRVQIGGPTGAFVVIVFGIVATHGLDGLILATLMAGVILLLFGLFRLGRIIQFIPYPVITGFTAGIGAIIFLGQLKEVFGLRGVAMPGETVAKIETLARHAADIDPVSVIVAVGTVAVILAIKRFVPRVPGPVVALVLFTIGVWAFHVPVETVGERFGRLPGGLSLPGLPEVTLARLGELLPSALTIALLGAIESLLSAVVADGMTDLRHDPDQELIGQGIANLAAPLFGGLPATGAIARTATNIQNGGTTPVAGMVHAGVVLIFITLLVPLAGAIPLSVLAGILVVVAYNMSDVPRFKEIPKMPRGDALVLVATFLITFFVDLVTAVEVGMVLAALLFMLRMSDVGRFEVVDPTSDPHYARQQSLEEKVIPDGAVVYSIDGPFFFGAAARFQRTFQRIADPPRVLILRMRHVPYMDATGLAALEALVKDLQKKGATVVLSAVQNQPLELMERAGFVHHVGDENVVPHIDAALERARRVLGGDPPQANGDSDDQGTGPAIRPQTIR